MTENWELIPEIALKFFLAIILAGAVGLERERKGRSAGLRTHILVCFGSTLAMVVADIIALRWMEMDTTVMLDQGRIAAGVITGVGFLGAGTIINVGGHHRGLTTAALIWFVAALGMAIGTGLYAVAFTATAFALFVVVFLEWLARFFPSTDRFRVSMQMPHGLEQMHSVENFIREQGYELATARLRVSEQEERAEMTFELISHRRPNIDELAQALRREFASARRITVER